MLVSMTLTLTQGHSGLEEGKCQHRIISTSKQAISIELSSATVGHDNFYFSLKSSVAFVLNHGHTGISHARHTYAASSVSFAFGVETKDVNDARQLRYDIRQYFRVPLSPTSDGLRDDIAGRVQVDQNPIR